MLDGTASQEVFHFQVEAELVLPAHLYKVMLLRFGFRGIGTSTLGVPKFSLQVFFLPFFVRQVFLLILSCFDSVLKSL